MSRKLRIDYSGAMYYVMNRGDQREDIFRDDQEHQKFLSTQRGVKPEIGIRAGRMVHPRSAKYKRARQKQIPISSWITPPKLPSFSWSIAGFTGLTSYRSTDKGTNEN